MGLTIEQESVHNSFIQLSTISSKETLCESAAVLMAFSSEDVDFDDRGGANWLCSAILVISPETFPTGP